MNQQYQSKVVQYWADNQLVVSGNHCRLIDNYPHKNLSQFDALSVPGGDLSLLWKFINIPENDQLLVLAWLLECFRAETPFPILALSGQQGSAKSSTQNKLRQLVRQ